MPFVSRALSGSLVVNAKNQTLRDKLRQFSSATEGGNADKTNASVWNMCAREIAVIHGRSLLGSHKSKQLPSDSLLGNTQSCLRTQDDDSGHLFDFEHDLELDEFNDDEIYTNWQDEYMDLT
jgi:hypothetical protein